MYSLMYRTRSCKPPGSGLAGKCAKVIGGGLHEGGGSLILERGWLKGNSVQRHKGAAYKYGGGLHERVRYISHFSV